MKFDIEKLKENKYVKKLLAYGEKLFNKLKEEFYIKKEEFIEKAKTRSKKEYAILIVKIVFFPITISVFLLKKLWLSERLTTGAKVATTGFIVVSLTITVAVTRIMPHKVAKSNESKAVIAQSKEKDAKEDSKKTSSASNKSSGQKNDSKPALKQGNKTQTKTEGKKETKSNTKTEGSKESSSDNKGTNKNNDTSNNKKAILDDDDNETYIIPEEGNKYHVDGCPSKPKAKERVSKAKARAMGYGACKKCQP